MIIDFEKIATESIEGFRGGVGRLETRNIADGKCKIMMSRLKPGASSGYHKHEQNSETVYVISGEGHFHYDGADEPFASGDVHYCPMGHSHSMHNDGSTDLVYFAIVAEHH